VSRRDYPEIRGRWASIVTDHGFGSKALLADFDPDGRYRLTWIGPLPTVAQESGSQPIGGEVEEGKYYSVSDLLYLTRTGENTEKCTVTLRGGVLVLAFDEHRIYAFAKVERAKNWMRQ
jgi:hypothetical protein